jgi:hypothetical protein
MKAPVLDPPLLVPPDVDPPDAEPPDAEPAPLVAAVSPVDDPLTAPVADAAALVVLVATELPEQAARVPRATAPATRPFGRRPLGRIAGR